MPTSYPAGDSPGYTAPPDGKRVEPTLSREQEDRKQFEALAKVSSKAFENAYKEVYSPQPSVIGKAFSHLSKLVNLLQNLKSLNTAKDCEEFAKVVNEWLKAEFIDNSTKYGATIGAGWGGRSGVAIGGPEGAFAGAVIGGVIVGGTTYYGAAILYDQQIAPYVLESARDNWEKKHPDDECGCKHQSPVVFTKTPINAPKANGKKPVTTGHHLSPYWNDAAGSGRGTNSGNTSADRSDLRRKTP